MTGSRRMWATLLPTLLLLCALRGASVLAQGDPLHALEQPKFDAQRSVFSPDGKKLAVIGSSLEENLHIWDVETGKLIAKVRSKDKPCRVAGFGFTPDGKQLVGCTEGRIHVWDTTTWKEVSQFPLREGTTRFLVLSPDGKTAAVTMHKTTAVLYDVQTGKELGEIVGDPGVTTMAFSPDGKWLAVNYKNRVVVWEVATRKELKFLYDGDQYAMIRKARFTPDGKSIFVQAWTHSRLVVWDFHSGKEGATLNLKELVGTRFNDFTISNDGTLLAVAGESGELVLWDLKKNERIKDFKSESGYNDHSVRSVSISPDNKLLASIGRDHNVKIWKIPPPPK